MIYSLNGLLIEKLDSAAVIECGGVGYLVSCSTNTLSTLPAEGQEVYLYTVFSVKENAVELAGFTTKEERDLFKLLCSVSGVGPKLAFSVLSTYLPDRLILLIGSGDSHALTSCPGVGGRIAQRIVVELKDKVPGIAINNGAASLQSPSSVSTSLGDAMAALIALGFSSSDVSKVLSSLDPYLPADELIRSALQILDARNRR